MIRRMELRLLVCLWVGAVIPNSWSDQLPELHSVTDSASLPSAFSGTWINERGSLVHLVPNNGLLSGYYRTNLGKPELGQRFPLTGFVDGDVITFSVNFSGFGSMTSWTGQLSVDDQGEYIRTLWHLTRDVDDDNEAAELWQSITAGASTFRRAGISQTESR